MLNEFIYWIGTFCLISFLILILSFIQLQIYCHLQRSQYFWMITFLYIKAKIYYKSPKDITLKAPNGKKYKIIEVDRKNETIV